MSKMVVLKDVEVFYARLNQPILMHQKTRDEKFPLKNHEYALKALIPAKQLADLKKSYRKANVKAFNETKLYSASEFEEAFKVEAPDVDVYGNEDGEFEVIKFNKSAAYKDGSATKRPQVVGFNGKDKKGLDVGVKVLMGNGTLVNLQLAERTYKVPNGPTGTKLDLFAVQVIDLIEYEAASLAFDDVGDIPEDNNEEVTAPETFEDGDQPEMELDDDDDSDWEDD